MNTRNVCVVEICSARYSEGALFTAVHCDRVRVSVVVLVKCNRDWTRIAETTFSSQLSVQTLICVLVARPG